MELAPQNIFELLPQAPPFVMVGQLTYSDETTTRSTFTIRADNSMVFNGTFSEGGLLENIAQTAAARVGHIAKTENKPIAGGYIGAVKDFEVFFLPAIGNDIMTEIKIENQIFNVSVITGQVWCNNELAARCEMKVFLNAED
ncbi:3-hydroxyacyl-ACP dehydratase [Mucilaginibacter boryungensis]|uniref:3-hydroxyacyl-ACP dehydratase n=1 Tax=Mucilaginibacter boryungensis TaxID=768480 RepID=A0ABR9XLT7_9SPHI|nr:3-hydroxyacyl-ACP dehydratase [Mucilaginibacter boryungensis]MBE9668049.1 3-hydroxyacyl-ACP dehydratase [Mucilaginibacter boryungensis]